MYTLLSPAMTCHSSFLHFPFAVYALLKITYIKSVALNIFNFLFATLFQQNIKKKKLLDGTLNVTRSKFSLFYFKIIYFVLIINLCNFNI